MGFKGQLYYFAVGASAAKHATIWRLWSPQGKSDVYLGPRFISKSFKLSVHESGVRLLREKPIAPRSGVPPPNVMRWLAPARNGPGHEFVWGIITPFGALRDAKMAPRFTGKVAWVPEAAIPYTATEFLVLLSFGVLFRDEEWPGSDEPGIDCLLRWRLPNGETLFLLRRIIPLTTEQSLSWGHALITTRLPQDWDQHKGSFDHRAHLYLDGNGYRGLVDLAYDV